jgi:hypothetical protein
MKYFPGVHEPDRDNTLGAEDTRPDFDLFYRNTLRKLLLAREKGRYLAKNNYNITRLGYLNNLFPDARFIIPVRDPVWHVASLIKQHRMLEKEEKKDSKVLDYMRRVGHFEFGLDLRPINTGASSRVHEIMKLWQAGDEVGGWAVYWADLHTYLYRLLKNNRELASSVMIVSYEELCASSEASLHGIYSHACLDAGDKLIGDQSARLNPPGYYRPDFSGKELQIIRRETGDIYRALVSRSGNPPTGGISAD